MHSLQRWHRTLTAREGKRVQARGRKGLTALLEPENEAGRNSQVILPAIYAVRKMRQIVVSFKRADADMVSHINIQAAAGYQRKGSI